MKALSLTQPWATLVAVGFKKIETRSWSTPHRGLLAIHAAKGFPPAAQDFADQVRHMLPTGELPRGAVVALVTLDRIVPTAAIDTMEPGISHLERQLGDYTPGRFMWKLSDPKRFPEPIPVRGHLGLWEWSLLGVPGARDEQFLCFDYRPGPHEGRGRCETDGHYLCNGCSNRKEMPA